MKAIRYEDNVADLRERAARAEEKAKQLEKTVKVLQEHLSTMRAALDREIKLNDFLRKGNV